MDDLMEHIYKAREYAIRDGIREAMIIIDTGIAKVNGFLIQERTGFLTIPPMIMGMSVKYDNKLKDLTGANFIITEDKLPENLPHKELCDYSNEELMEELNRRLERGN